MKISKKSFLVTLFLGVMASSSVYAQEEKSQDNQDQDVEKITVVGKSSVASLKKQMKKKSKDFMLEFNKYVEDPDLRFKCDRKKTLGSNMIEEKCTTAFESRIKQELLQEKLTGGVSDFNDLVDAEAMSRLDTKEIKEKRLEQAEALKAMLNDNAAVRDKFAAYYDSKLKYEKAAKIQKGQLASKN